MTLVTNQNLFKEISQKIAKTLVFRFAGTATQQLDIVVSQVWCIKQNNAQTLGLSTSNK